MSITTEDDLLFAIFAKNDDNEPFRRNLPARSSALCIYSLKAIEEVFADNIRKCAEGGINRGLEFIRKDAMCSKTVCIIEFFMANYSGLQQEHFIFNLEPGQPMWQRSEQPVGRFHSGFTETGFCRQKQSIYCNLFRNCSHVHYSVSGH